MPTSRAASGLYDVASIALPYSVRPKNQDSAATASPAPPSTHRLCGNTVAPRIVIGCVAGERRQRMDALVPHQLRQSAQQQRRADRDDDQRDRAGVARRLDGQLLEQQPHRARRQHRERQRRPHRQAGADQRDGAHAADHHELALREVDRAAGVVDDREAERDQRVDRARGQPAGDVLEPLAVHGREPPCRPTSRSTRRRSLISSITNALRSSPMWSFADILTTPPVPT